jgi:hypothetical protein
MMAKKSFIQAPQPKALSDAEIAHFVEKGIGKDNGVTGNEAGSKETLMRLAFLLPVRQHNRFKSACALQGLKMADEIRAFIQERTEELEKGL